MVQTPCIHASWLFAKISCSNPQMAGSESLCQLVRVRRSLLRSSRFVTVWPSTCRGEANCLPTSLPFPQIDGYQSSTQALKIRSQLPARYFDSRSGTARIEPYPAFSSHCVLYATLWHTSSFTHPVSDLSVDPMRPRPS